MTRLGGANENDTVAIGLKAFFGKKVQGKLSSGLVAGTVKG